MSDNMNISIVDEITNKFVYDDTLYSGNSRLGKLFAALFVRALGYTSNPRNLGAHWKPVYSLWLAQIIRDCDKINCFQEQPVWWTRTELSRWDQTITAAQGGFVTLYPDLGLVRVDGRRDTWILIGELKRSPKRGFIFNADLERKSKGWRDLRTKITQAIHQVEQQAYLALHKPNAQTEFVLLAACGPFWTYAFASFREITALFRNVADPFGLAGNLEALKEEEEEEEEESEEQANKVLDPNVHKILNVNMTRDDFFGWNAKLDHLRTKSRKSLHDQLRLSKLEELAQKRLKSGLPWANVMFLGTQRSNKAINTIRAKLGEITMVSGARST
ncbi:hypothetical protein F5887DRAFT_959387 [Amanita rubescens]|nr:hypothetical protein F5887DRAFT_959387 [Amanita rubescens]